MTLAPLSGGLPKTSGVTPLVRREIAATTSGVTRTSWVTGIPHAERFPTVTMTVAVAITVRIARRVACEPLLDGRRKGAGHSLRGRDFRVCDRH